MTSDTREGPGNVPAASGAGAVAGTAGLAMSPGAGAAILAVAPRIREASASAPGHPPSTAETSDGESGAPPIGGITPASLSMRASWHPRQGELERGAMVRVRRRPEPAPVVVNDRAADR